MANPKSLSKAKRRILSLAVNDFNSFTEQGLSSLQAMREVINEYELSKDEILMVIDQLDAPMPEEQVEIQVSMAPTPEATKTKTTKAAKAIEAQATDSTETAITGKK